MNKIKSLYTAAALALLAPMAHAGALADAVTAEVDKTELLAIGAIVLGLSGIVLLIRSGRKSSGG